MLNSSGLMELVVALIAVAFVVERFVEHLVATPLKEKAAGWAWVIPYIALVLGILAAFGFRLNLPAALEWGGEAWAGMLFTGVLVGFGSNFVSDFIERFLKAPVIQMRGE